MDDESGPLETVSFLARSAARVRCLEHLLETETATQRELREALDTSRSTAARTTSALQERNLVEKYAGTYRLTPVGEVVVQELLGLLDTVRTTEELSAFLRWFPLSEQDVGVQQLRQATVTTRTQGDPYAPARTQTALLDATRQFRGILPSIDLEGTRLVHGRVMDGELEAEVVVSPDVERTVRSGEFAELFRESMETGRQTVLVAEDAPSFYLGLGEDAVQVGVEDDDGFPRALLESDDPDVRAWAEDCYRDVRESARQLTAEAFQ
jgi:predicted transcriptional regulator